MWLRFFGLVVLFLLCPLPASAYNYLKTAQGQPIRWAKMPITWSINPTGFPGIPANQIQATFQRAFNTWASVRCAQVTFVFAGQTPAGSVRGDNQSVISWPANFEAQHGVGTLFAPSYLYNAQNQLIEVDAPLNPKVQWSLTPSGNQQDLEGAAMALVGHYLGLQASTEPKATMAGQFWSGEINKRTLHPDDIEGVCFLYPSGKTQCDVDGDCPFGLGCQQNKCIEKPPAALPQICKPCKVAADCGPDMGCQFLGAGSFCVQECNPDGLCPATFTCNGASSGAVCLPATGNCPAPPCQQDGDCQQNQFCVSNKCLPAQCLADNECPRNLPLCRKGQCIARGACVSDADCAPNETCIGQQCVPKGSAICTAGASRSCTCTDGKQGSQLCAADGKSWDACKCGSTQVCNPGTTQFCKCPTGGDGTQTCKTDGSAYDVCVCSGTSVCTAGTKKACLCTDGKSGEQTCKADGSAYDACVCSGTSVCPAGAKQVCTCTDGKTGDQTCKADGSAWEACVCSGTSACTPGSTQACICASGTSTQTCKADGLGWEPCPCVGPSVCAPGSTQACVCTDGKSGAQTCQTDGKAWAACQCSGVNPSTCQSAAQCPTGQSCVNGSCQATSAACQTQAQCPAGNSCVNGLCTILNPPGKTGCSCSSLKDEPSFLSSLFFALFALLFLLRRRA